MGLKRPFLSELRAALKTRCKLNEDYIERHSGLTAGRQTAARMKFLWLVSRVQGGGSSDQIYQDEFGSVLQRSAKLESTTQLKPSSVVARTSGSNMQRDG